MRSPDVIISEIRALTEELAQAIEAPSKLKPKRRPAAPPPELPPSQNAISRVRRSLRKNGVTA